MDASSVFFVENRKYIDGTWHHTFATMGFGTTTCVSEKTTNTSEFRILFAFGALTLEDLEVQLDVDLGGENIRLKLSGSFRDLA